MSTENHIFTLKREAGGEPFPAQVGDDVVTFAHSSTLDQFALAELFADDQGALEFITNLFRLALSEEDYATLRKARLTRPELDALYEAYTAHCGTGESPASSD